MVPMLRRGDLRLEGRRRAARAPPPSWSEPPPVVMLTTQLERCLITLRNGANASGDWSGRPSLGLRACRCTTAAPASAAPMAASAISLAVIGRCGDIDGVWIEPVTAQVMMTLRALAMGVSSGTAYWVPGDRVAIGPSPVQPSTLPGGCQLPIPGTSFPATPTLVLSKHEVAAAAVHWQRDRGPTALAGWWREWRWSSRATTIRSVRPIERPSPQPRTRC